MSIKPSQKQLEFLSWEVGVFFHFGIRTFFEGHKDWDGLDMEAEKFNPEQLDCAQWAKMAKTGGARYAIMTTKHHDGFCLWPTKYSEYSVKNAKWKDGNGDVVKEFCSACRKHDLKVGLYYSPAQKDYKLTNPKEYDDYFINQISELLSNYGTVDYIWFDGCGSEGHEYDKDRIVKTIRTLQPGIMIFSMWDPDVRWVGNEEGIVPCNTGYVVDSERYSVNEIEDTKIEPKFLPYECDCRIRRKNWFYSEYDAHLLRSPQDLVALYDYSVGRGGNLLLNFAPDRRGLIPQQDCENFRMMKEILDERFSKEVKCDIIKKGDYYILKPENPCSVNTILLEEELSEGQKIKKFTLSNCFWEEDGVSVYSGGFVGHKCIGTFPQTYANQFKLTIDEAEEGYKLNTIKLFMV